MRAPAGSGVADSGEARSSLSGALNTTRWQPLKLADTM